MKQLRLWLLVLLVALLPIRGAMAAGMLCAPAGMGPQTELRLMEHDSVEHHEHHGDTKQDVSQDKCTLCAAFCSAAPLLSAVAGLPEPAQRCTTRFPTLEAPAPTFQSSGQERPPRSI